MSLIPISIRARFRFFNAPFNFTISAEQHLFLKFPAIMALTFHDKAWRPLESVELSDDDIKLGCSIVRKSWFVALRCKGPLIIIVTDICSEVEETSSLIHGQKQDFRGVLWF